MVNKTVDCRWFRYLQGLADSGFHFLFRSPNLETASAEGEAQTAWPVQTRASSKKPPNKLLLK